MAEAAHSIPLPTRCATCGHLPPPPMSPEVKRFHDLAAQLHREAREARDAGKPQVAVMLRKRALNALDRALAAVSEAEATGVAP